MYSSLKEAITDLFGSSRRITGQSRVHGGDINEAFAVTLDDGFTLFMKRNRKSALAGFEAEADGLHAIRETGAIGVPGVLGIGTDGGYSFLLLTYAREGVRIRNYWDTFAEELAAMHRSETDQTVGYGFTEDNWIGARKQVNTPCDSWIAFFRDCRLRPQFDAAEKYFSGTDHRKIRYLLEHLDRYLTEPGKPSLVHGDLWAGNVITGPDGKGWLIDPAVYYGHPEADLAMTELFGGFGQSFYKTYMEISGLAYGYPDRRDLYNLYQLLNHLNMFGSGYLPSVRTIINRYGG